MGFFILTIGVIISGIFMLAIYKIIDRQDEEYEDWDNDTCTPADYTLLVRLTSNQIENFDKIKGKKPSVYLNSYLKEEI